MGQAQGLGEAAVALYREAPLYKERTCGHLRVDSEGRDRGNGTCVKD